MGILDKGKEVLSLVGSALFDPRGTNKGTEAAQKLIDSGAPLLSKLTDQINASTKFWIDHKALLGSDFTDNNIKEALFAREQRRAKKSLEGSTRPYDAVDHRNQVEEELEDLFIVYMDKFNKASKYRLESGLAYTSPLVKATVAKYTAPTRRAFNNLSKEVTNSYGIDKQLLSLFGFGRDRDLSTVEIGDYSFLMQEGDSPTKRALIAQLTKEIESGLNSYGKMDAAEIALAMEQLQDSYTPALKTGRKSPGESDNNTRITSLVKDMMGGKPTTLIVEKEYISVDGNSIPLYKDYVNDLDSTSKSAFYKDLRQYASWIANVYDDAKLVPEGGTKHDEELLIIALDYMIENDKFRREPGWFGSLPVVPDEWGINSGYTPFTDNEKRNFFDNLPEYLNKLTDIDLTGPQRDAVGNSIDDIRAAAKEAEINSATNGKQAGRKPEEVPHPLVFAKGLIEGTGDNPKPLIFESEEEKRETIKEFTLLLQEAGKAEDDIVQAVFMLERIDVSKDGFLSDSITEGWDRTERPAAKRKRLERELAKSLRIEEQEGINTSGTVSLLDRDK